MAPQLHDLVLEPSGAVSLSGFFHSPPQLRANTPASKEAKLGNARRCMLWNGKMICADYPSSVNGKVSAIDLNTVPQSVSGTRVSEVFSTQAIAKPADQLARLLTSGLLAKCAPSRRSSRM